MGAVLSITAPIFGLAALGYALVRLGLFSAADMPVLGRFVMWIGMPAILFRAGADPEALARMHAGYMAAYALGLLCAGALAAFWFRRAVAARRSIAVLGAMAPNSGYIGYAIIGLSLPGFAGTVLTMNTLVEIGLVLPIAFALIELARPDRPAQLHHIAGRLVRAVLLKPISLALFAGLAVGLAKVPLHAAFQSSLSLLAQATPALAMIYLGGILAGLPRTGTLADAFKIASARLILAPLLTVGVLAGLSVAFHLTPELRVALILSTAMPMLGIYPILAQDLDEAPLGALALLLAMAGGFVTLSVLVAILVA